jgi:hypothetical protein
MKQLTLTDKLKSKRRDAPAFDEGRAGNANARWTLVHDSVSVCLKRWQLTPGARPSFWIGEAIDSPSEDPAGPWGFSVPITRINFIPFVTWPNAAKPWPSRLRLPPKVGRLYIQRRRLQFRFLPRRANRNRPVVAPSADTRRRPLVRLRKLR